MFNTTCPKCSHDGLMLIAFTATCAGVPISKDGFNVNDANQLDTSDEVVHCGNCDYKGPLTSDDDDKQGQPVNRIAYSVDEDSIRYRWDDIMEDRDDDDQVSLNWNDLETEVQDTMLDRIGNAITNSGATEAVDEAIFQVATSYMEAVEADTPSLCQTCNERPAVAGVYCQQCLDKETENTPSEELEAAASKVSETQPTASTDASLLISIQDQLDGVEWHSDTAVNIAALMRAGGYTINDIR